MTNSKRLVAGIVSVLVVLSGCSGSENDTKQGPEGTVIQVESDREMVVNSESISVMHVDPGFVCGKQNESSKRKIVSVVSGGNRKSSTYLEVPVKAEADFWTLVNFSKRTEGVGYQKETICHVLFSFDVLDDSIYKVKASGQAKTCKAEVVQLVEEAEVPVVLRNYSSCGTAKKYTY